MHTGSLDMLEADRLELATDTITARATTENFPVALRILSAEQRRHLMAIYGFARLTDQIGDAAHGNRLEMLDELQRQVDSCFDDQANGSATARHPIIEALAPSIRECTFPVGPFHRLIDANRLDQVKHRCENYQELLDYCDLSANPVGELVLYVFGVATPERIRQSDAVCTALQFVEHREAVAVSGVADLIGEPREAVDRHQVSALLGG